MLLSSDFTITLSKSNDYLRCALLIQILALIALVSSALPRLIIIVLVLVLAFFMIDIYRSKVPLPNYQKLSYHPGYWLLHQMNGHPIKYEQASIGFDGGLFILLTLTGKNRKKNLVIFNDQMTTAQNRLLKLLLRKA